MAILQSTSGNLPAQRQTGGNPNNPGGTFGENLFTELSPQYYTLLKAGRIWSISALGINPTAFTGGAAGTPIIGIYNPVSSPVDIVLIQARLGIRSTGTAAAATMDFGFYAVNQGGVAVTGTQTQARNMYSQQATGSNAYCMVNVANTASLASFLISPSVSLGAVGASAALNVGLFVDDIKGAICVPPGCYMAWGASLGLTAGSLDATLIIAEMPV